MLFLQPSIKGDLSERSNEQPWKGCIRVTVSRVRISQSPQTNIMKSRFRLNLAAFLLNVLLEFCIDLFYLIITIFWLLVSKYFELLHYFLIWAY